eukprot:956069-Amphidinium_carterae.1
MDSLKNRGCKLNLLRNWLNFITCGIVAVIFFVGTVYKSLVAIVAVLLHSISVLRFHEHQAPTEDRSMVLGFDISGGADEAVVGNETNTQTQNKIKKITNPILEMEILKL